MSDPGTEMRCFFTRKFHSVFIEIHKFGSGCLYCTVCTHQLLCLPGFGGFVCVFVGFLIV